MKGNEALRRSYEKQKATFETARQKRMTNRTNQIREIQKKINSLRELALKLQEQNKSEPEFESFESFRLRSEAQRRKQED